jgi:hypothetical protein
MISLFELSSHTGRPIKAVGTFQRTLLERAQTPTRMLGLSLSLPGFCTITNILKIERLPQGEGPC